jgi:hypothetical protein
MRQQAIHAQYPEWVAFVGSHVNGRFSSRANGLDDVENSQEEDWKGVVMWALLELGLGTYAEIADTGLGLEVDVSSALKELRHKFSQVQALKPVFVNVNGAKQNLTRCGYPLHHMRWCAAILRAQIDISIILSSMPSSTDAS